MARVTRAGAEGWGKYGRRPLTILALVAFIDSVDRGILPGVLTEVQDDLSFSDIQAGLLGTAFVLAGFVVVLPAGYLADRYSRTRIIAMVLSSWGTISALNAVVRNFTQFLAVRAALGVGETVDNPASASLIADYYPPARRGRAYALQRVAPQIGMAVGTGIGGVVGALFGWQWAFLVVGVPGSLLAVAVWRLPEPVRGEHDAHLEVDPGVLSTMLPEVVPTPAEDSAPPTDPERGMRAMMHDVKAVFAIPTLRALMAGTAVASGALSGLAFWGPTFLARHTVLTPGQASGVAAALVLVGALTGTLLGGVVTDRLRDRVAGAPMLLAGIAQAAGAALMMIVFLDVPLVVRLPCIVVGVMFVVSAFPALATMTSEVVGSATRGLAFSVVAFSSGIAAALSPLVIGAIADQFEFVVDDKVKGNLAYAFLMVTPLVFVGAFVLVRGRHNVASDIERAHSARTAS